MCGFTKGLLTTNHKKLELATFLTSYSWDDLMETYGKPWSTTH
jgi:hypothetical protein